MFEAKSVDYKQRVERAFQNQPTMKTLNVTLVTVEPGRVIFEMPFQIEFSQQHGFMQGGILAAVLDSACGFAAFSLMPQDGEVLTIEMKTNFLAPGSGETFRFEANVLKPGRTISFVEATVHAVIGEKEKKIATMQATIMTVQNRPGVIQIK